MFPIRDENPTIHTSIATFAIIGANILSWVFLQGFGFGSALAKSVCMYGFIPGEFFGLVPAGTRVSVGAGLACVIEAQRNWLSPFTSMFMHGGWLHLIGNMWFLAVFGDNVEDVMGPVKFAVFYILCGLAAAGAQALANPASAVPMVGASGAIGGVMGAYFVLFPRAPVHMLVFFGFYITRIVIPAFFMLGYWFLLQLFQGVFFTGGSGGVAIWAHIGGFFSGILLLRMFCTGGSIERCRRKRGSTDKLVRRFARYI